MEWNNWAIFVLAMMGLLRAMGEWAGDTIQGDFPEHKDPPEESE